MGIAELLGDAGWPAVAALSLLIGLASMLQLGAGVGFGTIAAPSSMLLVPILMPGSITFLGFVAATLGVGRIGAGIDYRQLGFALLGRCLGSAAGGWLAYKIGSRDGFALAFAVLTLLAVALSLVRVRLRLTPSILVGAGIVSGIMATITTIGGPPIALVYQNEDAVKARATMNAFFSVGNLPPIAALWVAGLLDGNTILRALVFLPAIGLGVAFAHLAHKLIVRRYKVIILSFCTVSALIIAGRALVRMAS